MLLGMLAMYAKVAYIDASIVQRSVVGPPSFISCASLLRNQENIQVKYADDAYNRIGVYLHGYRRNG